MSSWLEELEGLDMKEYESPQTGMDDFLSKTMRDEKESALDDLRETIEGEDGGHSDQTILEQKEASTKSTPDRVKVSSTNDLDGFKRIANSDTLVRLSEKDFWELKEEEEEGFVIERLYNDDGEPLEV